MSVVNIRPQLIDNRMTGINARNYKFNLEVLLTIVEAVIMCGKQRIALQGHKQDKINFDSPTTRNKGNFIALARLLAGTNSCLDQHLRTGPANGKYISKNIQNEILEIAADQIRDFYRECLRECAHLSVVADEVTSHGQEILSVCLRFLEVQKGNSELKPKKHEVLLDFAFLQRITGNLLHKVSYVFLKSIRLTSGIVEDKRMIQPVQ